MILIDSSAWIDFFRGKNTPICGRIEMELHSGNPAICGPIWLELIRGVKKDRDLVLSLLNSCHWLENPDHIWEEAGELGRFTALKGYQIGSIDLLIAVYALAYRVPLLAQDEDFQNMVEAGIPLILLNLH